MIAAPDHVVLTVRDIDAACDVYRRVLGLEVVHFGAGRRALQVGAQKINLQTLGQETRNHAAIGCGDLCLLTSRTPQQVPDRMTAEGVDILQGPVVRTGACGPVMSACITARTTT